jgi:hypothetical protein
VKKFAKEPKKDLGNALRYLLGLSPEKIHPVMKPPSPPNFQAFQQQKPRFLCKSTYFIEF